MVVENPKHIECTVEDKNKKPPQLKVLSIAMKTFKNERKTKEIAMISCLFNDRVECEKQTNHPERNNKVFSCMRKLNGLPFPYKFVDDIKNMKTPVSHFNNEKAMLEFFISKVAKLDPDLIVAHGLCSGMFDTLIDRIDKHKVNLWSRIGRFKKNLIPKSGKKDVSYGGFWVPRQATIGRLL